jgi:hypothetical protein
MSEQEGSDNRVTIQFKNGDLYQGTLKNNRVKHGYGVYTYANGDVYEGEWADDEQQGTGILRFADGSVYEGTFERGQPEGEGTYHYNPV